ncbi:MAG: CoA ester lyase [Deltaproteobacteria bacterium]|nr:CoA ester lyase [Deltaproteobacteria bacterium]
MNESVRPRRSVLYMPGSNARALEKAQTLAADGFIFDLEDAVGPDAKEAAREAVTEAMRTRDYGHKERIVRVNALSTPWGYQDVVRASTCGADAILIPKVESADTVRQTVAIMNASGAPASMAVWCMMETPLGILHAEQIASSSPRLAVLVMGTSDLTKDLHASHTPDRLPQLASLAVSLLAARAYGLGIIDGVHLDLNDEQGFERSCIQGRDLGFDGKTLIHPKTIEVANRVFAPSQQEIDWARKIAEAHERARSEGKGVVVVDGKLIENLHVEAAQRTVRLAEAIAARTS